MAVRRRLCGQAPRHHQRGRPSCRQEIPERGHQHSRHPHSLAVEIRPCRGDGSCPMIRATLLIAALVCDGVLSGASHAAEIKPTRVVTENGMTVLIVDQPFLPIVTVNVLVKAGAVYDPDAKAGLSYMVAGMLDEGTQTRSATQIAEQIEFIGGDLSTDGGEDFASAKLRVLKKDAELAFTLLADILM